MGIFSVLYWHGIKCPSREGTRLPARKAAQQSVPALAKPSPSSCRVPPPHPPIPRNMVPEGQLREESSIRRSLTRMLQSPFLFCLKTDSCQSLQPPHSRGNRGSGSRGSYENKRMTAYNLAVPASSREYRKAEAIRRPDGGVEIALSRPRHPTRPQPPRSRPGLFAAPALGAGRRLPPYPTLPGTLPPLGPDPRPGLLAG